MRQRRSFTIRGVTYPDADAAAAALGVSARAVYLAAREGRLQRLGRYKRLEIRGMCYRDDADAAAALGVTVVTIQRAVRLGVLDRVGLGLSHPEPLPVSVRGQVFDTARAAADHFGVGVSAIYMALGRGTIDRIGLPPARRRVPVRIGPLRFSSKRDASTQLGVPFSTLNHVLKAGDLTCSQAVYGAALRLAVSLERAA